MIKADHFTKTWN